MKHKLSEGRIAAMIITAAIVIDQAIKWAVKLNMHLHESIRITDWFYIYFTENPGMAFGMEIFAKLFLTLFRIVAVAALLYYLVKILHKGFPKGYLVCVSLIIAGAMGNIFDSVFYGEIFSASTPMSVSELVPWGKGYGDLMHGMVVDMFYFPLFEFDWPQWVPFIGGDHFLFFSPIFNFADACISCGVIAALLFYSKCISRGLGDAKETEKKHEKA